MERPAPSAAAAAATAGRPSRQIYRPPGLRSGSIDAASASGTSPPTPHPPPTAGQKQPTNDNTENENNNVSSPAMDQPMKIRDMRDIKDYKEFVPRLNRTQSSMSQESQRSGGSSSKQSLPKEEPKRTPKGPSPPKATIPTGRVKTMSEKDKTDAASALRSLAMNSGAADLEQFIASSYTDGACAEGVGAALCQHALEGGGGRQAAKAAGFLKDSPALSRLLAGAISSMEQYYDCRDKLRVEHFRLWISFLGFVSDLYVNVGAASHGELVDVVFQVFHYLLTPPVLETLKIEELESLISALLSAGYELERECPDRLAKLKDVMRDALVSVSEPWARKMILLLVELGASGWKLPPEASEYYFQQTDCRSSRLQPRTRLLRHCSHCSVV